MLEVAAWAVQLWRRVSVVEVWVAAVLEVAASVVQLWRRVSAVEVSIAIVLEVELTFARRPLPVAVAAVTADVAAVLEFEPVNVADAAVEFWLVALEVVPLLEVEFELAVEVAVQARELRVEVCCAARIAP